MTRISTTALDAASAITTDAGQATAGLAAGIFVFIAVKAIVYFLPAVIALLRAHEFKWVMLAMNLAAGWTVIGWAAALIWAVWPREKSLIDPFVGNPTGLSHRNAGDAVGAYDYGRIRGFDRERRSASRDGS